MRDAKPDSYGYVSGANGKRSRRHPKCRCEVPCQRRFWCECDAHRGNRLTPYCCGADDAHPDYCDECATRQYSVFKVS